MIDKALDSDGKANTNGLGRADYWSSSEGGPSTAKVFIGQFHSAYSDVGKEQSNRYVRAVRAF